jgi:hypothetical protein
VGRRFAGEGGRFGLMHSTSLMACAASLRAWMPSRPVVFLKLGEVECERDMVVIEVHSSECIVEMPWLPVEEVMIVRMMR